MLSHFGFIFFFLSGFLIWSFELVPLKTYGIPINNIF